MKKFARVLTAVALLLISIAPFITQSASACSVMAGETEIPECLK